jgi:1,4-dihydroxy-2-naphthoyl-CoA hydrolase
MSVDDDRKRMLTQVIDAVHEDTVLGALGMRFTNLDKDEVTVEVDVGKHLFQHAGIVHGGVYVLLAESAASTAAALAVDILANRVTGMEINANHLLPVTEGALKATARPIHRGKTTHVYGIEVRDDKERLISIVRCTVAIRAIRDSSSTT